MKWDEWRGSQDGRPTMWIRCLVAWRGFRIDLHKFIAADERGCFHTHPAKAWRLILWGGYVEQLESGRYRIWRPWMAGFVRPELSHRIALLWNGRVSYSLWIRWPKSAEVQLRGDGWHQIAQ